MKNLKKKTKREKKKKERKKILVSFDLHYFNPNTSSQVHRSELGIFIQKTPKMGGDFFWTQRVF